jgi:hypothetical protein
LKTIVAFLLLVAAVLPASAGEHVILYATLLEGSAVELSDGSKWQMDKGDCFPVVAYKQQHTVVILQLASASFVLPAAKTRLVADKELPAAVASYRANVNTYINGFSARWRSQAEAAGEAQPPKVNPAEGPKPAAPTEVSKPTLPADPGKATPPVEPAKAPTKDPAKIPAKPAPSK